jgi:hypothetical protein
MFLVKIHNDLDNYDSYPEDIDSSRKKISWNKKYTPSDIARKYKNGRVYQFMTLKEVGAFLKEAKAEINFTEDYAENFSGYDCECIEFDIVIDNQLENVIHLYLDNYFHIEG